MDLVHNVNAYTVSASSSEFRSKSHSNRESVDCWERHLPVSLKGRFFQDSYFENTRTHVEEKVKRILDDWEESEILFDDWFNKESISCQEKLCRNHRTQNQEKRIVTVTSEDGGIKILLDVREFTVEEIRVRVVGERQLEVEGHQKQKENETSDIYKTPNNFRYLISLPENAEMNTITSAMSSDGILSISVYIKQENLKKPICQGPTDTEEFNKVSFSSLPDSAITSRGNSGKLSHSFNSLSSNKSSELIKMDKDMLENFGEMTEMDMNEYQSSFLLGEMKKSSSLVSSDVNMNSMDIKEENRKEIQADSWELHHTDSLCEGNVRGISRMEEEISINWREGNTLVMEEKESEKHLINGSSFSSSNCKDIPVIRRGCIAKDPFFENIRKVFCLRGDNAVVNWEEISIENCDTNKCCFYEDNIVKSAENHSKYMYLLDVRSQQHNEEITMKFLSDNELLIEIPGEGKSKVPSFQKRLVLPENTQKDSILSSLSSDGWMVITVQKKTPANQPNEFLVPINLEETHIDINNSQASEFGVIMELQSEQTFIDDKYISEAVDHRQHSTTSDGHMILSSESFESETQRSDFSTQKLDENVIQEENEDLRKHPLSNSTNQAQVTFHMESDNHSSKNLLVEDQMTNIRLVGNTENEITVQNNNEPETTYYSISESVVDCMAKEDTERNDIGNSELNNPEAPVEEVPSYRNDISSLEDLSLCDSFSFNVSQCLNIVHKGSFFSDSCFVGMQEYYLQAVREILSKYGNGSSACDEVTTYKNLVKEDLDNKRAEVTFGSENYLHFILDVDEFQNEGEINIKIINKDEIVIEMKSNEKENNDVSTKNYSKFIEIKDQVDLDSAEATLSSEGILVITLTKKLCEDSLSPKNEPKEVSLNSSEQCSNYSLNEMAIQSKEVSSEIVNAEIGFLNSLAPDSSPLSSLSQNEDSSKVCDSQNKQTFHLCVVNVADEEQEEKDSNYVKVYDLEDQLSINEILDTETNSPQRCAEYKCRTNLNLENVTKVAELKRNTCQDFRMRRTDNNDIERKEGKDIGHMSEDGSVLQEQGISAAVQSSQNTTVYGNEEFTFSQNLGPFPSLHTGNLVVLEVEEKGSFYEDKFFEGMRKYLSGAAENVLLYYDEMGTVQGDKMTLYRNGLKKEQQKSVLTFEDECYQKIVVDAQRFKSRNVTVKISGKNIIIEGFQDEYVDRGFTNYYSETISISDEFDINSAIAGISSDGILAIVIRKRQNVFSDEKEEDKNLILDNTIQTGDTTSSAPQETFCQAANTSTQEKVFLPSMSSALISHVSSTAEMVKCEAVEPRRDFHVLNETEDDGEEVQIHRSYQCRTNSSLNLGNGMLSSVQDFSTYDGTEDNTGDNLNENEENYLEASTVTGTPRSLITDAELSSLSSNVCYKGSLVESNGMEPNGITLADNEVKTLNEEGSYNIIKEESMFEQSSKRCSHSSIKNASAFHSSYLTSAGDTSRMSTSNDQLLIQNNPIPSSSSSKIADNFGFSDKETHSRKSNSISTQMMTASNDLSSEEEDFKTNSANPFILLSNYDKLTTDAAREDLFDVEHNIHSEVSETSGFSWDTIQSLKSYKSTTVQNMHCSESRRFLTLTRKGTFFEDSYFNEVQESFLSAMREVLRKSNDDENCRHSSDIATYKCWRKHNHKIEKQAVYIHDDLSAYKVVLDLEGLSEKSLLVSVVDGKKLLIEGQAEILTNSSSVSHSYSKSFTIPNEVNVDCVTATLSSDGILFIESPKK